MRAALILQQGKPTFVRKFGYTAIMAYLCGNYPIPLLLMSAWLSVAPDSDFSIHNFPFGICRTADRPSPRPCTALGDYVIDLAQLLDAHPLESSSIDQGALATALAQPTLNDFIGLGKTVWQALRRHLIALFSDGGIATRQPDTPAYAYPQKAVQLLLPLQIGDYTDFYSSIEHATNVGIMFRGKDNALMPNWKHIPIAYHGRASSIVVSGIPLHRPKGQTRPDDNAPPIFGITRQLDFELETAMVIGKSTQLGQTIDTDQAQEHIFGLLLFNDWSARDIQKWEYQPLGPFLGKNFGSSVSPWIVTLDALEPFRIAAPAQDPAPLPYLQDNDAHNYDIHLSVQITTPEGQTAIVSRSNTRYMYWTLAQQLAHHTSNGCNINIGDLMASGTISAPDPTGYGSMLELAWRGTQALPMPDGSTRTFILDGDTVTMHGYAEKEGIRVGFGNVSTTILPAL